ncbi:MAG: hypothetical protein LBS01_05315 [Prevotellaceae bacterium]|jgi:hypothetical protein|nr:hypothetical protein [Prevotellaceae bacterium]
MNKKILTVFTVFVLFSTFSVAQQNDSIIKKSVTVEREYIPVIQPAGKIETSAIVVEPQKTALDVVYSDFMSPLALGGNVHPLAAATLLYAQPSASRPGFARLSAGFYPNTLADFSYPLIDRSDMRLDAVVKQKGAYNEKYSMTTSAQLSFDRFFDNATLFGALNAGYQGVKYYGQNFNANNEELWLQRLFKEDQYVTYTETDFTQIGRAPKFVRIKDLDEANKFAHFFRLGANAGVRSSENAENLRYYALLKYGLFHNTSGVTEHLINFAGRLDFVFNEDRVGLEAQMYNTGYYSKQEINFYKKNNVLVLQPYFELNRFENINVHLGVLAAIGFAGDKKVRLAPDIGLDWKPLPETLKIYAGIKGKYKVNTMSSLFYENPYLASDVRVRDTYTPLELYGGLLIKPAAGLLIDVFADYSVTNNEYFFINKAYNNPRGNIYEYKPADSAIYTNRFDVVYDKSSLLILGGHVSYTYRDKFNVDFTGKYFTGPLKTQAFPWQRPELDLNLNASYKVVENINISFTGYYQSGLMAKIGSEPRKMKNRIDLNLGASYTWYQWLTLFVTGNNLLNSKYDIYYGYEVQGINLMLGATMSF